MYKRLSTLFLFVFPFIFFIKIQLIIAATDLIVGISMRGTKLHH